MKKKRYVSPAIEVLQVTDELMNALSDNGSEDEKGGSAKGAVFESDINQKESIKSVWN
jgi:hypothetical protein